MHMTLPYLVTVSYLTLPPYHKSLHPVVLSYVRKQISDSTLRSFTFDALSQYTGDRSKYKGNTIPMNLQFVGAGGGSLASF